MNISDLPYRLGVGIMLINQQGNIFVAQRIDKTSEAWQMPQGGIDEGESPLICAYRELEEETGVQEKNIKLIHEFPEWLTYDLPEDLIPKLWKGRYRGQKQRWFIFELMADDSAINIETEEPEFSEWRWDSVDALPDIIVPFKRKMYEDLAALAKPVLQNHLKQSA
ncbi:MAG: RNA pyrophosphohydrolase [Rickettsiales bacterium]|nr:RNA pyrophosphohydrolase [Rickettsiales bacterium]